MPNRSSSWYEEAVIYNIDVEKFADGNGDGIGDFVGLEKLTYLLELGASSSGCCRFTAVSYASTSSPACNRFISEGNGS